MKNLYKRLSACALALITACSFMVAASASSVKYGDVDASGKINSTDALRVLKESVSAGTLSGDALIAADVNGDGKVNSTDALEILMVAVGKRTKFTIEINIPAPSGKADMLKVYADAVSKARAAKPSYKIKVTSETKDPQITGLLADFVGKDAVEEMKQGMITKESYQNIFSKGSDTALSNLPLELAVTDPAKFKNVTYKGLSDGNYEISIELKDEKNSKAGSVACKVMNLPEFDVVQKQFEDEMNSVGSEVPMTVSLDSLEYKNCKITCVVDSTTGEFLSLTMRSDMVVSLDMSMGLPMNMKMTTQTVSEYTNFGY